MYCFGRCQPTKLRSTICLRWSIRKRTAGPGNTHANTVPTGYRLTLHRSIQELEESMNRVPLAAIAVAAISVLGAGCHKKVAASAPPAPAPGPAYAAVGAPPGPALKAAPAPVTTAATKSRMPDAATRARIDELLARIQDAYFDYDRHILRPDAEEALKADANTLGLIIKEYPDFKLVVQGNCDDRGSEEYNLALGDARAKTSREYLASLGIPAGQMNVVSFGKDKPVCTEHSEACWQKNRRAHLTTAGNGSGS
jgi:peptidoglycan-associated lipoprotein